MVTWCGWCGAVATCDGLRLPPGRMLAKPCAMPALPALQPRRAVVALGANLGDRQVTLDRAVALLAAEVGEVAAQSAWLRTPALIHPDDPAQSYPEFLNG